LAISGGIPQAILSLYGNGLLENLSVAPCRVFLFVPAEIDW
jgi:hypothetical protein